jgi:hypothetical protein
MKKILVSMLVMATLNFSAGYAMMIPSPNDVTVSSVIQESFKKEYPNAEFVKWEKNGDYFVANFNNDMQRISVYFDEKGGIYSTTRFIKIENLPLNALKSVMQKYDVKESELVAMEVAKETRTYYLVNFIKDGKSYIIESDATGNLQLVKKQKVG